MVFLKNIKHKIGSSRNRKSGHSSAAGDRDTGGVVYVFTIFKG